MPRKPKKDYAIGTHILAMTAVRKLWKAFEREKPEGWKLISRECAVSIALEAYNEFKNRNPEPEWGLGKPFTFDVNEDYRKLEAFIWWRKRGIEKIKDTYGKENMNMELILRLGHEGRIDEEELELSRYKPTIAKHIRIAEIVKRPDLMPGQTGKIGPSTERGSSELSNARSNLKAEDKRIAGFFDVDPLTYNPPSRFVPNQDMQAVLIFFLRRIANPRRTSPLTNSDRIFAKILLDHFR